MSLIEGAEAIQGGVRIGQFVIEGRYNYKRNKLEYLKVKAARFIFILLSKRKENLYSAKKVPRPKGKQRNCWEGARSKKVIQLLRVLMIILFY